ncbi:MAG: hydroxymyristoyl-ACP dehydratase [Pseudomonadota bacterium]|nr:hydroxymyristoyl-ACP dehydratase [Pseudomonadota bacterium]
MSPTAHATIVRIEASHPALPGHFPGQPIVPGVVLLDCVLQEAERWLRRPLRVLALANAKFTAPLLPDEPAELQMKLESQELRFSLSRDGAAIAQGLFRIAPPDEAAGAAA